MELRRKPGTIKSKTGVGEQGPPIPEEAGRKFTEPVRKKILSALRRGNTRRVSFSSAGICASTFYNWLRDTPGFADQCAQAEAHAEERVVNALFTAGANGNVQAALAWLKKMSQDDWSDKQHVEHTVNHNVQLEALESKYRAALDAREVAALGPVIDASGAGGPAAGLDVVGEAESGDAPGELAVLGGEGGEGLGEDAGGGGVREELRSEFRVREYRRGDGR